MLYAIGDIHGELDALEALIEALPLRSDDRLIFMGDYVDRGPDSRGVVDYLIKLAKKRTCIFLIGNHESMFLDFLGWDDPMYFAGDAFLMNGGDRTLVSYDYFDSDLEPSLFKLPKKHEAFFRKLKLLSGALAALGSLGELLFSCGSPTRREKSSSSTYTRRAESDRNLGRRNDQAGRGVG